MSEAADSEFKIAQVPCPFLPEIHKIWRAQDLVDFRNNRGSEFYFATLCYAQSLWLEKKPAQALLQINKSFLADLSSDSLILKNFPPAYQAKMWLIWQSQCSAYFLGNPVRHYQHLATRMSGPRSEVRSLRAWACFYLAEKLCSPAEFPRDEKQLLEERIAIPRLQEVLKSLASFGWLHEIEAFEKAYSAVEELSDRSLL